MVITDYMYGRPCTHRWVMVQVTSSDPSLTWMEVCCRCNAERIPPRSSSPQDRR